MTNRPLLNILCKKFNKLKQFILKNLGYDNQFFGPTCITTMTYINSKFEIRIARRFDYPQINEWDEFWGDRRQEMQRGELYVADFEGECLGYLRITRNEFLNYPLIAVVCTKPKYRRTGIAFSLMMHIESVFKGLRVFGTTEVTNQEMIALFKKSEFYQSGFIDNLNSDGSRELIFTKQF